MKLLGIPKTIGEIIERLLRPMITPTLENQPAIHAAEAWKLLLRDTLEKWRIAPLGIEDEGVEPPSTDVVDIAVSVSEQLLQLGFEPPNTIVPNGDGGIVFRWRADSRAWSLEIDKDGSIEANLLEAGKLAWRHTLHQLAPDE